MKSILIILPYFGEFNNYFQLFLNSCGTNPTINWQLITDQSVTELGLNIPDNIFVEKCSFGDVQKKVNKLWGSNLKTPYELCKYRTAYLELFDGRVKDYDFWGFCDCDLIFGNLRFWITDDVLENYDKISWRGHLTLFKNVPEINNLYKLEITGIKTFKGCIFETDGINLFDEVGINKIFEHESKKIYTSLPFCDLRIRDNNFVCQHEIFDNGSNVNQIFEWNQEGLFRTYVRGEKLSREAVAYVHFLKRPMKVKDPALFLADKLLIVPNKFIPYHVVSVDEVMDYSKKRIYWSYIKDRLNFKFIISKIKWILTTNKSEADIYERPKKK